MRLRKEAAALAWTVGLCALLTVPGCSSSSDGGVFEGSGGGGNASRFVDNGDGTVLDTRSGLVWLKDASCLGKAAYGDAHGIADSLGAGTHPACNLTDASVPGDWRLPTVACPTFGTCAPPDVTGELASLFALGCTPSVANTAGDGCWSEGNPFVGVQADMYWSWSCRYCYGYPYDSRFAADLMHCAGVFVDEGTAGYVWPVRAPSPPASD